jgi:hypothetical protein
MSLLHTKLTKLISTTIVIALVLITGHFCLSQTTHATTEHSHSETGLSTNDSIEKCCQGDNAANLSNVITHKNYNIFSDSPTITTNLNFHNTYALLSQQSLLNLDTPPPNQFLKQSFRVLLC